MLTDDQIIGAFNQIKEKHPDWTFYRCKLRLKKVCLISVDRINQIAFFKKELGKKISKTAALPTGMDYKTQLKLLKLGYDKNNIITKALFSTGSNTTKQLTKETIGICRNFYHKKHHAYVNY